MHVQMMLGVHVDDIVITSSSIDFDAVVRFLGKRLPTNSLGELTYDLGCVFERDRERGAFEIIKPTYIYQ